jgi:hypothetical protein
MPSPSITITTNPKGKILQIRRGRRVLKAKKTARGPNKPAKIKRGTTLGMLCLELLEGSHENGAGHTKKRGSGKGLGKGKGKGRGHGGGGTNPCCFRDPNTGRVWCFC